MFACTSPRALLGEDRDLEAKRHLRHVLQDRSKTTLMARWLSFQRPDYIVQPNSQAEQDFLSRWREGIAYFEDIDWTESRFATQADAALASTTKFHLAYLPEPLVDEQRRNANVVRAMTRAARPDSGDVLIRAIGRKRRRIAIVSPSLRGQSVERIWSGALLALDPALFELCVFCPNLDADGTSAERWRVSGARFESGSRPAGSLDQRNSRFCSRYRHLPGYRNASVRPGAC